MINWLEDAHDAGHRSHEEVQGYNCEQLYMMQGMHCSHI
jgi:hypothetical protein